MLGPLELICAAVVVLLISVGAWRRTRLTMASGIHAAESVPPGEAAPRKEARDGARRRTTYAYLRTPCATQSTWLISLWSSSSRFGLPVGLPKRGQGASPQGWPGLLSVS